MRSPFTRKSIPGPVIRKLLLLAMVVAIVGAGCASRGNFAGSRAFDFQRDTFSFANELVWEYHHDENGNWVHQRREPKPDYTHHCFVVARAARQFFQHAKFDPTLPKADAESYRQLIARVVGIDPSRTLPDERRVVIPGYANLREFSAAHEQLLKAECGGAWRSYFQRGHWRMLLPISRNHQAAMAERLIRGIRQNRPPVVHVVRFPQLTINHALLLFDVEERAEEIVFTVYDPNNPETPVKLAFDRATRTFEYPENDYFPGGAVDIYEIYRSWNY